jgi:aldehyde dehydrogenase (NAD+)
MPVSEIDRVFDQQHRSGNLQRLKDDGAETRLAKICRVEQRLLRGEYRDGLTAALRSDLRKCAEESLTSELAPVLMAISHLRKHLRRWMRDEPVRRPLTMVGMKSFIRYEPKGHVLVLAPWNYPFQLTLLPLLHAVAAGNAVMVKPSEHAPATTAFLRQLLAPVFPENEVALVEGEADVAESLLEKPFHHIFFTGSPQVGRNVMTAAARHLASVTLELGGKSPVIVDPSYNAARAALKIAWAKMMNCGQTCIAPDYLLVHETQHDQFVQAFGRAVERLYDPHGEGLQRTELLARIVNRRHFRRVKALIDDALARGAAVLYGGEMDEEDLFVGPTLLGSVTPEMQVMQDEIFAPVLPVIAWKERAEVLERIHQLPKPLALYVLSNDAKHTEHILRNTSAGGTAVNELMVTTINANLPFGGINTSGVGKANGRYSFREFSNARGVVKRRWGTLRMLYPPYNKTLVKCLLSLSRW